MGDRELKCHCKNITAPGLYAFVRFPKQDQLLHTKLPDFEIIEEHGDGDLTVKSQGKLYVVTTDGKLFEEK